MTNISVPTPSELIDLRKKANERYYEECKRIANSFCEALSQEIIRDPGKNSYRPSVDQVYKTPNYTRVLPYDHDGIYKKVIKTHIQYMVLKKGWYARIPEHAMYDGLYEYSITIHLHPLELQTIPDFDIRITNYTDLYTYVKTPEKPPSPPKESCISKLKMWFLKLKK